MVADDLRRQADHFVELVELQPLIAREGLAPRQNNYERQSGYPAQQQSYVPQPVSLDND
jgi:hypothetical protein